MPELPEIAAIAAFLADHAVGQQVTSVHVASLNLLTTYDPPTSALIGRTVTGVTRRGKYLDVVTAGIGGPDDRLHLVLHLSRAGWVRWSDSAPLSRPKMGGPIALRVRLSGGGGWDMTEAGTKRSSTVAVVADPGGLAEIARLGPDALGPDGTGLGADRLGAILDGSTRRLKTLLTDQSVISGIGNAYSDEILHRAKLSPFAIAGRLDSDAVARLSAAIGGVLLDATERCVGSDVARLKSEKRAGLRVHARTGLPCPECGDTIASVSLADRSFEYCPTCQTGGRVLADRRTSKFLR